MIAANQRRSVVMVKTMVAAQKTTLVMEGKEIAIMINNVLDRWYAVKITALGVVLTIAANICVVRVKTMVAVQKTNLVTKEKGIVMMIQNVVDHWYVEKITALGETMMIAANENEGKRYLEKRSKSSFCHRIRDFGHRNSKPDKTTSFCIYLISIA